MARFADWYSVELDGYLKGRMSDVRRFEAIKEIMSHLAEHVDDLMEKGMEPIQAEKAAISSFGSPRDAALNLLNQGPRWRFGGMFHTLGGIALFFSLIFGAWLMRAYMMHLGMAYNFTYGALGSIWAVPVLALLGGFFSRNSDWRKLALGWAAGLVVSGCYLVFGPQPTFADVPKGELPAKINLWTDGLNATKKLASLERQIESNFSSNYDDGRYQTKPVNKEQALDAIRKVGPQLLQVKPSYVSLNGKLTAGFLVPTSTNGMNSYYYRTRYHYSASDHEFNPPTGEEFPWTYMNLKYVATADEALDAWASRSSPYRSSSFEMIADEQQSFLSMANRMSNRTNTDVATEVIGSMALSGFIFLLIAYVLGFIASKIPTITFYSSFRRRLA
ncbi:MAG: hypothetical protein JST12_02060 [Armatimonadetes bacterium]|nr:hypothetical protein [Armatimonadota bacterium]